MRQPVFAKKGAPPMGPYSPAIIAQGPLVFVSGQGPLSETGVMQLGTFSEQAHLTFRNVGALLEAAGTSWSHVVRVGVFLADMSNFASMNEIYKQYAVEPYPARTTVQAGLPPNMAIEVDCVAVLPNQRS
jgi:2-iminobutanoate/2-iminopropanoate deaminase